MVRHNNYNKKFELNAFFVFMHPFLKCLFIYLLLFILACADQPYWNFTVVLRVCTSYKTALSVAKRNPQLQNRDENNTMLVKKPKIPARIENHG